MNQHDKFAPFWAAALVLFCSLGLSSIWFDFGNFWNGYLLDMTGPAWNYILFRGLFTRQANNFWTRFFTPAKTLVILFSVAVLIELLQFLQVYPSTFDPFDFPAYASLLIPLYLTDRKQHAKINRN